ncbi:MAG: PP2C family protein-serine/threonine phosphatase, partial [Chloroflexi bacterium]|nr:PP2C family protein-serine/threonine phosphatase [Chloroflexota bacterium]
WDIAAGLVPARQTSGDFYDFVPLENGGLGVIVADVADKGTGAALYMALSRTLIRTFALQFPDAPERALQAANERILTDAVSDQFVTVFYGILRPDSGQFIYANAGHNPVYVLRNGGNGGNGSDPLALIKTGVPLGMFEGLAWQQAAITIEPGDTLLLYSDGVSEAQNAAQDEFGEDQLVAAAGSVSDRTAAHVHTAIMDAVTTFTGDAPQFDDITLVVAVRQETPSE